MTAKSLAKGSSCSRKSVCAREFRLFAPPLVGDVGSRHEQELESYDQFHKVGKKRFLTPTKCQFDF
jgi:hypothetical protein